MSTSLLYHALGLKGYEYQRTKYLNGSIFFHVKKQEAYQYCTNCRSRAVVLAGREIGDVPDKLTFLTEGAGKADGVNGWIDVTDNDLLALLSRHQRIDEVNFWQPGGRTISK